MYVSAFATAIPSFFFFVGLPREWWVETSGEAFSPEVFLTSASGLVIIAAFIVMILLSLYYYASVSMKIKAWWWL